jgi:hypothetical protein
MIHTFLLHWRLHSINTLTGPNGHRRSLAKQERSHQLTTSRRKPREHPLASTSKTHRNQSNKYTASHSGQTKTKHHTLPRHTSTLGDQALQPHTKMPKRSPSQLPPKASNSRRIPKPTDTPSDAPSHRPSQTQPRQLPSHTSDTEQTHDNPSSRGKFCHHNIFNMSLHQLRDNLEIERPNLRYFNMVDTIRLIRMTPTPAFNDAPWSFRRTKEAAINNTERLRKNNFNMDAATQNPTNTILSYGTEFREPPTLAPLLHRHPQWPNMRDIMTKGVEYPLRPIPESDRLSDIAALQTRGNHKSATTKENRAALTKALNKEVQHRWAIPLLPDCIPQIPGASITPLGVAVQWSINEENERIIKRRTTHDCTFPGPSGMSCNKRVIEDLLDDCTYGHALRRFLHGIHDMRRQHPNQTIWINKTDMDAAYRRLHTHMSAAVTCITIFDELAYLLTRVPFGASPGPSKFSCISDASADLAQDLCLEPTWHPHELHSDFDLDFEPRKEPQSVPFGQADDLLMVLPPRDVITDNFIDDFIQACVDVGDLPQRIKHSVPLILDTLFRPVGKNDHAYRDPIINMTKHQAEGRLEERKVVLGWMIDSRRFMVSLTTEKARDWLDDIDKCIDDGKCTKKLLESTIGRLNHTSIIVNLGRYFLTRLRFRLHTVQHKRDKATVHLAKWDIDDLILWKHFLTELSTTGISINNICTTAPSATVFSDACEWGLGGFSTQGHAWRYLIPLHLRNRASINFLEFLAAIITIKLSLLYDTHDTVHPHILAFTDSSSALGWMYHSTFNPVKDTMHDTLARHLARHLFDHRATLHPEHIPGKHNVVADSLSRDFHLTPSTLTSLLLSHPDSSSQAPKCLDIKPLPPQLTLWIASTVGSLTQTTGSLPRPSPSNIGRCPDLKDTSIAAASKTTDSLTNLPQTNESSSSQAMPTMSDKTDTDTQTNQTYKVAQFRPPSQMWFRPSGRTYSLTPHTTPQVGNRLSSHDN